VGYGAAARVGAKAAWLLGNFTGAICQN